jgi:hypothetical protein
MKPRIDRFAVAARIRGLIGGRGTDAIAQTARRLGIGEVTLRISVDELDPHPTIEVVDAIIHEYGVDPTWLLTGAYDPASHRRAIDEELAFPIGAFARLLGPRTTRGTGSSEDLDIALE